MRILVADDDPPTLALVADAMQEQGYEVTRAEDGDELLQSIAEAGPFDLVITDISMPWMSGLQVAHSVRAAGATTPVLVMTALAILPSELHTLGADALLLRKPFGVHELLAAVAQLLPGDHATNASRTPDAC